MSDGPMFRTSHWRGIEALKMFQAAKKMKKEQAPTLLQLICDNICEIVIKLTSWRLK